MNQLKFLIFTPGYDENVGGIVSLHRLCHELNQIGTVSAALTPFFETFEITQRDILIPIGTMVRRKIRRGNRYRTKLGLDTPVIRRPGMGAKLNDYVVIYPEVVGGNPLKASKVVRWLMYHPGQLTGKVCFGPGEMYVPFSNAAAAVEVPGSVTVDEQLKIVQYPLDIYYPPPAGSKRSGVAYAVRKGWGKPQTEHPVDAVCIDGLTHREIAEIFRRVETFVSYDPHTAYSMFAAVAGCDSVVIPDPGVAEEVWYPDSADRLGIAYGWSRLQHARSTRHLTRQRMLDEEGRNSLYARTFVNNVSQFFGVTGREH